MGALNYAQRIPILGASSYSDRVLRTRPYALIGYWPLSELAGAVAKDLSREANNGAYTGVDLGQGGIGDGKAAPWFDGTNDYCDIYSAALNTDFSGAEGSVLIWAKVNSAAVWTDNADRRLLTLLVDANNQVTIWKWGGDNGLYFDHVAGATTRRVTAALTPAGWFTAALTWSVAAAEVKAWYDGAQQGATQGAPGTWAGALSTIATVLGAATTVPGGPFHGWLAHCALWSAVLTPAEIAALGRL